MLPLEPEHVAIVLGLETGKSAASFSPVQRSTLCSALANPTVHSFLASAFLIRLDQDFASDLAEDYQEKHHVEAGAAAGL